MKIVMVIIVLATSVDPDEILCYAAFIRVFTVCQSTHLGVTSVPGFILGFENQGRGDFD